MKCTRSAVWAVLVANLFAFRIRALHVNTAIGRDEARSKKLLRRREGHCKADNTHWEDLFESPRVGRNYGQVRQFENYDIDDPRNYTISSKAFLAAAEPKFETAMGRLSRKLMKLAVDPDAHVKVTIVGNSMTAGHSGSQGPVGQSRRWSTQLQRQMHQRGFPNFEVYNMARIGGTTTEFELNAWTEPVTSDIFLVDMAISDSPPCCGYKTFDEVTQVTDKLIRSLANMPNEPAVLYLETFTDNSLFGYNCSGNGGDVTKFPHWPALRKHMVPTISYVSAICPTKTADAFWGEEPHPGPVPHHENIGRVTAGYFLYWMEQFCENKATLDNSWAVQREHPSATMDVSNDPTLMCMNNPLFLYQAEHKWPLPSLESVVEETTSWKFYEDVSGRPGWIAPANERSNITFLLDFKTRARLNIQYVKSYEGFGEMKCHIQDGYDITLNAVDTEGMHSYLAQDTLDTEFEGVRRLTCSSDGKKFKIVGLRACPLSLFRHEVLSGKQG